MFADLCIGSGGMVSRPADVHSLLPGDRVELERKIDMAARLGYECVATDMWFQDAEETNRFPMDQPVSLGSALEDALKTDSLQRSSKRRNARPVCLRRATLSQGTTSVATLQTPISKLRRHFDLVAVEARSSQILEEACQRLDVDVIYFNLSKPLPSKIALKDLKIAIRRGIHFEVDYNPAVRENIHERTVFFSSSIVFCKAVRGRNLIISSRARHAMELRGPYDIVNFAALMGLRESDAKVAISSACYNVLVHALQARSGNAPFISKALEVSQPEGEAAATTVNQTSEVETVSMAV